MTHESTQFSKFISYILRHNPDSIGLALDSQGWAVIGELVHKGNASGTTFSRTDLLKLVNGCDKKRFSVSDDGQRIRATHGHSLAVELGLTPQDPPHFLYHGTATRFIDSILTEGIKPQSRQQVHLSADEATAHQMGKRYGKPATLRIEARDMHLNGIKFSLANNGIWLTNYVPPQFISIISSSATDSATTSTQPKLSK